MRFVIGRQYEERRAAGQYKKTKRQADTLNTTEKRREVEQSATTYSNVPANRKY